MNYPVVVLSTKQKVGEVMEILKSTSHNGFPVVDNPMTSSITGEYSFRDSGNFSPKTPKGVVSQNKYELR